MSQKESALLKRPVLLVFTIFVWLLFVVLLTQVTIATLDPCTSSVSAFEASPNGGAPMPGTWTEDGLLFTNPETYGLYKFSLCHVPPGRTLPTQTRYGVIVEATQLRDNIYCVKMKD